MAGLDVSTRQAALTGPGAKALHTPGPRNGLPIAIMGDFSCSRAVCESMKQIPMRVCASQQDDWGAWLPCRKVTRSGFFGAMFDARIWRRNCAVPRLGFDQVDWLKKSNLLIHHSNGLPGKIEVPPGSEKINCRKQTFLSLLAGTGRGFTKVG